MSAKLEQLLDATLANPLAVIQPGGNAIGYVGFDVPLEVLIASGRPHCHLPWHAGRATPQADRWLESAFPGWARSILEDWLNGVFDNFTDIVFTRGDDASQRLYYYLCELQRRGIAAGPRPLLFDVANIPRATSVAHSARALRRLMSELGADMDALAAALVAVNHLRALYAQLDAERQAPGHWYERIARAALFRDLSAALAAAELPTLAPPRRLLLGGSVPPDDSLHRAAESSGWNVVGEVHQLGLTRLGAPLPLDDSDAVAVLARHCNAGGLGSRAFGERAAGLVDAARAKQAAAVVLWLTDEDEALAWHVARQRAALAAAGLPALVLTRSRWDGGDGATAKLCKFLQELPA